MFGSFVRVWTDSAGLGQEWKAVVNRNRRILSGMPEILSVSRNGSAACRYEVRPVFSIAPAMSWPRWLVVGYFTAETRFDHSPVILDLWRAKW
jgi:hypothetical protein